MEIIVVCALVVSGFSILTYLYLSHISKLELLIKAENLHDYKHYETPNLDLEHTKLEDSIPESLQDVFANSTPEEIYESFRKAKPTPNA